MAVKNRTLSLALIGFVLNLFLLQTTITAGTKEDKFAATVKAGIVRLGTGKESLVKLKLKDKTKVSGYVSEITEDGFTVVDGKTSSAINIPYNQVRQVKGNNLSKGATIAITIGVLVAIGILFGILWN